MEEYKLTIKTSDRFSSAGTIATVCVRIIGQGGKQTDFHTLDYFFKNDFQSGASDHYYVTHPLNDDVEVGAPMMLHFKLKGLKSDAWLCDDVTVEHNGSEYLFPVYDWLENEMVVMRGNARLRHQVKDTRLLEARDLEVETNKSKYNWNQKATCESELGWGIPRFIDASQDLPRLLRESKSRMITSHVTSWKTTLNEIRNRFRGLFGKLQAPADYKVLYRSIGIGDPPFLNNWRRDEEFGRQMLTGVSPLDLERCTDIPDYCQISDYEVNSLLPPSTTLKEEMKAGRIYVADYTSAAQVKRNTNPSSDKPYAHANCVALFYSNPEGKFLPLAIQLEMYDEASIFTPNDHEYDWLLAKIFMRCSSQSYHQWKYRFLQTNAVSKIFAIATLRDFPRCHPVYKLLRPHIRTVAHVNTEYREDVLSEDSDINKSVSLNVLSMLRHSYTSFHYNDLKIPKELEKKGLMDCKLLPNFPYRDDSLELWKEIKLYVTNVLRYFYENDESVEIDQELQTWAHDVALEGFGWQDGNTRGVPEQIESTEQLIDLCTTIIFTSSVQHALVNYGQMETYQFVPNSPCSMRLPVHQKGKATLRRIMETLPDLKASNTMISFSFELSQFAKDEVFLGETLEKLFVEKEVVKMQESFRERLRILEENLEKRNKELMQPYTSSLPSKIPRSIVN